MDPGSSLPHSQVHATCPYPKPDRSSPIPPHPTQYYPPSTTGSSTWSLSPRFPHQNPVHDSPFPIRATCPAHLILDFITRTIPILWYCSRNVQLKVTLVGAVKTVGQVGHSLQWDNWGTHCRCTVFRGVKVKNTKMRIWNIRMHFTVSFCIFTITFLHPPQYVVCYVQLTL